MQVLIRNGIVVNAGESQHADVLCRDGKIIEINKDLNPETVPDHVIDAAGCYLLPGGVDPHVHMHLPTPAGFSSDDFYSGSRAALIGGTTTIIDFVTSKKGQLLADAIQQRKSEAANCITDYSFHVSPVELRSGLDEEIRTCINKEGLKSFKLYMAYKDSIGLDDNALLGLMKMVGKSGGMVTVHCEMGDDIDELRNKYASENKLGPQYHPLSRPAKLEADAVKKAIEMADEAHCPLYIVHVSAEESLKHIEEAQKNGQKVIAETCPQYLLLDSTMYLGDFQTTAKYVISPPLREKDDINALWKAIEKSVVQTIGTDHCPFTAKQKELGEKDFRKIPNGAGGVEHRLALLYTYGVLTKKISINQFVALSSTNPAKIFGLYPSKGVIAVGADADIIIWDSKAENTISAKTHHQNCDINIYEGTKTTGAPAFVLLNGFIVVEKGVLSKDIPKAKFLKTNPL